MRYSFNPRILPRERLRSKAIFGVVLAVILCALCPFGPTPPKP